MTLKEQQQFACYILRKGLGDHEGLLLVIILLAFQPFLGNEMQVGFDSSP